MFVDSRKKKSQEAKIPYFILQGSLEPQSASNGSDLLLQPAARAKIIVFCWLKLDTMRSVSFHAYLTAFTMWEIFRRRKREQSKVELWLSRNDCANQQRSHYGLGLLLL